MQLNSNIPKLIKTLERKYGFQIFNDLHSLYFLPQWDLADIARKYMFTRERARQIHNSLYGYAFGPIKKAKTARIKQIKAHKRNNPINKVLTYKTGNNHLNKGIFVETLVLQKCKEMGFQVDFPTKLGPDLLINNYVIDVKSSFSSYKPTNCKVAYYSFKLSKSQFKECNFIIGYIKPTDTFYVIPKSAFKGNHIYIRETEVGSHLYPNNTNYREYKEAWHLLAKEYVGFKH